LGFCPLPALAALPVAGCAVPRMIYPHKDVPRRDAGDAEAERRILIASRSFPEK
jgi:hypothetical protein